MRFVFMVLSLLVCSAAGAGSENDLAPWKGLSSVEFYSDHRASIIDAEILARSASMKGIVGVRLSDSNMVTWKTAAANYPSIQFIRVDVVGSNIPASILSSMLVFTNTRYIELFANIANSIGPDIHLFQGYSNLVCLDIWATNAETVDKEVYSLARLRELGIRMKAVNLPGGISKMRNLEKLDLSTLRRRQCLALPDDLSFSGLNWLDLDGTSGVDVLLTNLPPNLVSLSCDQCGISEIPASWLKQEHLEWLDCGNNRLRAIPQDLSGLPSLGWFNLQKSLITNVPKLYLGGTNVMTIFLIANPIVSVAPENRALGGRLILEY